MSEFDYASAPESKAIANIASNYGLFIGGKFVEPKQGKSFNTFNPATEELLSKIGYADKTDIDAAVKSARLAYTRVWSKMPAKERGKYLYRIARIMPGPQSMKYLPNDLANNWRSGVHRCHWL